VNARGADLISVTLGRKAWALVGKPTDRHGEVIRKTPAVAAK
jgi:hypothetical protein